MLVLSRDRGERIFIGSNREIVITLVRQSGTGARIGIDAPKHMPIVREEIDDITAQHIGPLEDDGGPCGVPVLAPTERVDNWHHEEGTPPDLSLIGINPNPGKPR